MSALNLARSGKLMRLRREIGHLHYFSWDTALSTLEEAGYVVDSVAPNQIAVDRAQSMAARTARPVRMIGNRLSPRLASRIFGGTSLLVLASAVR
jgi:CBS domain containing-hemolysin-like protein